MVVLKLASGYPDYELFAAILAGGLLADLPLETLSEIDPAIADADAWPTLG